MDAEINNVIYMELYSGPKMAHGKYGKTNVAGSIDRDSTVYKHFVHSYKEILIMRPHNTLPTHNVLMTMHHSISSTSI
jgi:hypothetical protein